MTTPPPTMTGLLAAEGGDRRAARRARRRRRGRHADRGLAGRRSHTNRCSPTEPVPARPGCRCLTSSLLEVLPSGMPAQNLQYNDHHRQHPRRALGGQGRPLVRRRGPPAVPTCSSTWSTWPRSTSRPFCPCATPPRCRPTPSIDRADAFVVVTPEYNHSYPASLKQAIDVLNAPWRRKPVAFVSYGGLSGGLRAVEHLRQVFAGTRHHHPRDRQPASPPAAVRRVGALVDPAVRRGGQGDARRPRVVGSALRTARDAEVADLTWIE